MFLTLLCVPLVRPAQDESASRLRDGIEETRAGNFSAATADLEAAVTLNTNNPDAWYQLGLLRGQITDFPGAEMAFRRAIKLKPDFAQAHYSLGLTMIANPRGQLDWTGAIAEFREALKYKPEYPEALNMLGAGLTIKGETKEAIPYLQKAIEFKPNLAEAHFNLAIAYEKSDRPDDSEKEYAATLAANPQYAEAATAWGKLLFRIGKNAEAEQVLTKAVGLNPDLTDAHYTLARVLQSGQKSKQAEIEFRIAKELSERPANAMQSSQLSNQGLELAAKGDLPGAAAMIRKGIALKPDYGVPHYNLALILADTGDLNGGAAEFAKAISLLPGQAKPWLQLSRVESKRGNPVAALQAIQWAVRLAPNDASIQTESANLQKSVAASGTLATNNSNSAASPLRVGAVTDTTEAHVAFAEQLFEQKDYLGATGELLRALVLDPRLVVARRRLAHAYEALGEQDLAMLEYYKILATGSKDAASHIGLGEILLKQGDPQAAAEEFQMALNYEPDSALARSGLEKSNKAVSKH